MGIQNVIDRLENFLANVAAKSMIARANATRKASISAIVKRADGSIEDLGVISETETSLLKINFQSIKKIFKK